MKAMLTMIPNNGERTTMADGKVEVEEPQAGHRKRKEGKELFRGIVLRNTRTYDVVTSCQLRPPNKSGLSSLINISL